jgi:hypothetical protein
MGINHKCLSYVENMSNLIIVKEETNSLQDKGVTKIEINNTPPRRLSISSNETSPRNDSIQSSSGSSSPKLSSRVDNSSPRRRLIDKIKSLRSSPEKVGLNMSPERRNSSLLSQSDKAISRSMNDFDFQESLARFPKSQSEHSPNRKLGERVISENLSDNTSDIYANNSPPLSPTSTSQSSSSPRDETIRPRYKYHCHCCRGPLQVKQLLQIAEGMSMEDDKNELSKIYEVCFLAIRCGCEQKRYFCSRMCHRTHYVGLASIEGRENVMRIYIRIVVQKL